MITAERQSLANHVANATRNGPNTIEEYNGRRVLTTMQAARSLGNVDAVTLVSWQQMEEPETPRAFQYRGQAFYFEDELRAWNSRRKQRNSNQ